MKIKCLHILGEDDFESKTLFFNAPDCRLPCIVEPFRGLGSIVLAQIRLPFRALGVLLSKYMACPPIAEFRLERTDGTIGIHLSPSELIEKLIALIPRALC